MVRPHPGVKSGSFVGNSGETESKRLDQTEQELNDRTVPKIQNSLENTKGAGNKPIWLHCEKMGLPFPPAPLGP